MTRAAADAAFGGGVAVLQRILICDDESVLRTLVRTCLKRRGFEVLEAQDGDEAVEAIRSEQPDLVLLDLMMPGRTGLEVLEVVQADAELSAIPVLMLTARTLEADQVAAVGAGARGFLPKPFTLGELDAAVDDLLPG
jgi:DNA-binding response OmpR family regulator